MPLQAGEGSEHERRSSMASDALSRVCMDLLVEILARVDARTLAWAACVCTGLRGAAKEEALWKELCHGAWPSTTEGTARKLVSSMPGGFAKFYADSLPLLLYKPHCQSRSDHQDGIGGAGSNSPDLVSFVDVYYKKKCVLSRVVFGIPPHCSTARFRKHPFKLDALDAIAVGGGETAGAIPSILLEPKEEGGVGLLNWSLEEDLTLSWVVVDVGRGRAVNISGGRPTAVLQDWPSKGDLVVRFGCAMPVEEHLLACGVAECVISMWCQVSEAEDWLRCMGIELQVEDAEGVPVDWRRSLVVLGRALCYEKRTSSDTAAAEGYRAYVEHCRKMRKKGVVRGVPEMLCALAGVVLLLGLCLLRL